ncbi:M48 family metallopeptidase [Candidatus Saccharibacteria bacterium]|nr:M48 family metallopeptidase [Candidatus Saccharibacteria bacterium]
MGQKIIDLPGIGPVVLAKRRGTKNIRLSILPDGRVRLSMPSWVPYATAINFAQSRQDWINQHINIGQPSVLKDGQRIGKSYRLKFNTSLHTSNTQARLGINSITVTSSLPHSHHDVQSKAKAAAERALKKEANVLLGARLEELSKRHGFKYHGFKVKRLSSRWGSCSNQAEITLNYFLVQLPWRLIDYVIVHELAHTVYHNHSREFWDLVERTLPDARARRKEVKTYRPIILSD